MVQNKGKKKKQTWYKTKVRNKNKHGTKQRKEIKTFYFLPLFCIMLVFISYLCFVSCLFLFLTFVLYHVWFFFLTFVLRKEIKTNMIENKGKK
jgi:fatty acid desaturase